MSISHKAPEKIYSVINSESTVGRFQCAHVSGGCRGAQEMTCAPLPILLADLQFSSSTLW